MQMQIVPLKVKKLHLDAIVPVHQTAGAACFDLHSVLEDDVHLNHGLTVNPGTSEVIRTGLAFEVPAGYVMLIYSRSGHGFKNGVRLSNSVGVIDSDYRGEIKVALHNDSRAKFKVANGDRIAQAMLMPVPRLNIVETEQLSETERGAGGFGSTGR
jgi:dUTP pyrophosphatase